MASCSKFLSNAAYLDIVIVDNTQVFTVICVTFSLSSFLMLLITFLIQNGALRQSADSLSPARPSSHSSLVQDPSLPPPSRPFLPDLLSMGLALMTAAEIMSAVRITLDEIILCLCLFCVSNLKSIHPERPMTNIELRRVRTCAPLAAPLPAGGYEVTVSVFMTGTSSSSTVSGHNFPPPAARCH